MQSMTGTEDGICHSVQIAWPTVQKGRFAMDAVTDVFQSMRIASVIRARLEAGAPWGLRHEGNAKEGNGRHSATRFSHFGMLTDGSCWPPQTAYQIQFRFRTGIASCLRLVAGTRSGTIRGRAPRASVQSHQRMQRLSQRKSVKPKTRSLLCLSETMTNRRHEADGPFWTHAPPYWTFFPTLTI